MKLKFLVGPSIAVAGTLMAFIGAVNFGNPCSLRPGGVSTCWNANLPFYVMMIAGIVLLASGLVNAILLGRQKDTETREEFATKQLP